MRCWAGLRAGLGGWSHAGGPGRSCWGCFRICHARTAGRSPSTPGMPPRMGCSTCWPGRCGTKTACAMTCAPTWSSIWVTPRRCWWSTVPLAVLVRVAGRRWSIEERIKTSKGLVGLDSHQVRRWRSWYRWATLAMLAHAFLVIAALTQHTRHPPPSELIGLTCNELQHLFAALLARPAADLGHRLRWSAWRRRQQARARACHCRRQANGP
jgi:hypothetical protein